MMFYRKVENKHTCSPCSKRFSIMEKLKRKSISEIIQFIKKP